MRVRKSSVLTALIAAAIFTAMSLPPAAAAQDITLKKWFWTAHGASWYTDLSWRVYEGTGYLCENDHNHERIYMIDPDRVPNGGYASDYISYILDQPYIGDHGDIGLAWDSDHDCWWGTAPWSSYIGFKIPAAGSTRVDFSWVCHQYPCGATYDPIEGVLLVASNVKGYVQKWSYDDSDPANRPQNAGIINLGFSQWSLTRAGDNYWVSRHDDPAFDVLELDLNGTWTGRRIVIPEGRQPHGLAFDGRYLWVKSNAPTSDNPNKIFQYDIGYPAPTPANPVIDSGDYDGDSTSDIAVFRSSSGLWAVRGVTRAYFGREGDIPAPGDFNGDGTTDIALFRPSSGLWAVRGGARAYFGSNGDIPVPGDYTGDGTVEPGIFRESSGLWAVRGGNRVYFGADGDIPVPNYADGRDNPKRIGIFRPASGLWAIKGVTRTYFGASNDQPVIASYGSAMAYDPSPAIFREAGGLWAAKGVTRVYFGRSDDMPVPGNYNGFLPDQAAIFRSSSGLWAVRGGNRVYFGADGDIPVSGLAINPSTASQI